jgi:hypothetical protein
MATIVSVRRLFRQTGCKFVSKLLQEKDPEKAKRVMQAMLPMDSLGVDRLQQA